MGLFNWLHVVEPECEIDTLWKWLTYAPVNLDDYPCVGLLYWLTFPFLAQLPDGSVSPIPPAWFVMCVWITLIILCMYALFIKK